jgi:hypothetical protein
MLTRLPSMSMNETYCHTPDISIGSPPSGHDHLIGDIDLTKVARGVNGITHGFRGARKHYAWH